MGKIKYYLNLFLRDKKGFKFQVWMVYNRYKINSIKFFFNKIANIKNIFFTIHSRPVYAKEINTWTDKLIECPRTAIIIQGPLVDDYNFTLETVKLYKKHFANTEIIISTWDNASKRLIHNLEKEGAFIVLNKKPEIAGIGNINMQLVTTMGGLVKAKELGIEYVYKTRSDQRMYAININEYLINLINFFPVKNGFSQKKRIISSGFGSLKYVPYLLSDVWVFGNIDDMICYWGLEYEKRDNLEASIRSVRDLVDANICENRICSEFLKKIGRVNTGTVDDWWCALADHFIIVDTNSLDLFFYKYDFYKEYRHLIYSGNSNNKLLDFKEWFNLFSNLKNKKGAPKNNLDISRLDNIKEESE